MVHGDILVTMIDYVTRGKIWKNQPSTWPQDEIPQSLVTFSAATIYEGVELLGGSATGCPTSISDISDHWKPPTPE